MREYVIPKELKTFIEKMKKPFVLSQQTTKGPVAVAVSNGFCEMFGYADREQINSDIDHNMFINVHPQDTARISNEILRFSAEGSELNVLYRSMKKHGAGYCWVRMTGEYADTEDGVSSEEDESLLNLLKEKGITLEMCPTSNRQTHALTSMYSYPFMNFLMNGIKVTLNSDDMGIEGTNLAKEFRYMEIMYGLSAEQEKTVLSNAVDAAFTTDEIKEQLRSLLGLK